MSKLQIHIDELTIAKTKNCTKDLSCLKDNGKSLCKVLACVKTKEQTTYSMYCITKEYCYYKKNLNDRVYCSCPVRIEIFRKYKV